MSKAQGIALANVGGHSQRLITLHTSRRTAGDGPAEGNVVTCPWHGCEYKKGSEPEKSRTESRPPEWIACGGVRGGREIFVKSALRPASHEVKAIGPYFLNSKAERYVVTIPCQNLGNLHILFQLLFVTPHYSADSKPDGTSDPTRHSWIFSADPHHYHWDKLFRKMQVKCGTVRP